MNLLIEHGADPLIENEQGHLPSAYALQQRKELLTQFEKNVRFPSEISIVISSTCFLGKKIT